MKKLLYVLLTMTVVFSMVACGGGSSSSDTTPSSAKALTSLTVGDVVVSGASVPTPITVAQWADATFYPSVANTGTVTLAGVADLADAGVSAVSTGASIRFVIGSNSDNNSTRQAYTWVQAGDMTFDENDYLFVKVTAADNSVQYYAFIIQLAGGDARLNSLVIGGVTAGVGSGGDAWDDIPIAGSVSISYDDKVEPTIVATPSDTAVTSIEYALVLKAAYPPVAEPTWGASSDFEFDDGDYLYIKIVSPNGATTLYYAIEFEIGRNANLKQVAIKASASRLDLSWENDALYLGTPFIEDWDDAYGEIGDFQTQRQPSSGGLVLHIEAEDPMANIGYVIAEEASPPAVAPTFNNYTAAVSQTYDIESTYHLYIKVTAYAGNVQFYKTKLTFPAKGKLAYGNPQLTDANGDFYYDTTVWNDPNLPTFTINRVNKAESGVTKPYMREEWGLHTSAEAKAVWNDEGIFVYVNVTTKQYQAVEGGPVLDRPLSPAVDGGHNGDSFEVFVNERLQVLETAQQLDTTLGVQADIGNQFRVSASNVRTGREGGDSNTWRTYQTASGTAAKNDFIASGLSAVKTTGAKSTGSGSNGDATSAGTGGYEVVVFVPFSERANAQANAVFDNNKLVIDGAEIGLELQLNTCVSAAASGESRDGILTWNGVTTASYAHAEGYGLVEMNLGSATRVVNAERPTITTQPVGNFVVVGQPYTLTVAADPLTDGGILTYQWFKAAGSSGAGVQVSTSDTLVLNTSTADASYYYAVVTNTNNGVTGVKIATTTSNRVLVTIGEYTAPATWEERITSELNALPMYGFNLPGGKTFGDYDRVVFKVKWDPASPSLNARRRAFGDFGHAHGTYPAYTNPPAFINIQNATPGGLLLNNQAAHDAENWTADVWTEVVLDFNYKGRLTLADSIEAADGLIILALGMYPGSGTNHRIYSLKDIELWSNAAGTEKVPALYPEHPLLWGGNGAQARGNDGNASAKLTRELVPTDDAIAFAKLAPANGTLFAGVGSYNDAETFEYNNKNYWIVADSRSGQYPNWSDAVAPFDADTVTRDAILAAQNSYGGGTAGYTRIGVELATINGNWNGFDKVTIYYEAIKIGGGDNIQFRNNSGSSGNDVGPGGAGAAGINITSGASATSTTLPISALTNGSWINIVRSNAGAHLMRITKVAFFKD